MLNLCPVSGESRQQGPAGRRSRRGLTLVELSIVLLIMTILLGTLLWMVRSFSALRTSEDEAQTLARIYTFARRAAIKSGDTVFLELNLDEETYLLYRMDRTGEEPVRKPLMDQANLSSGNSLVAIVSPLGGRIETGKIVLPFYFDGTTEEVSIYLGSYPEVAQTVHFPRFAVNSIIEKGETLPASMPVENEGIREKERLEEQ